MKMFKKFTITRSKSKKKKKSFSLKFSISKRKRFVLMAILLSGGMLVIQQANIVYRYYYIGGLTGLTALLTAWSLWEDIRKIGWLMALILPTYFTASVNLFYYLLPENIWMKISLVALFAIGMYALMLTENIFVVAALRTIQLFRAAQALGFVFTLLVAFLLYDTVFSFRWEPWWNALVVLLISIPLVIQTVWSCKLEEKLTKEVVQYSFALSWLLMQLSFFISFWPVTIILASLFLVSMFYVALGIVQQAVIGRLFKKTIYEYMRVGVIVLVIIFLAARWGG